MTICSHCSTFWGLRHTGLAFWTLHMWGSQSPVYQQLPQESCGDSCGKQTPGYWLSRSQLERTPPFLRQASPPLPSTSGETLPPLLTGSAHAALAAKAGGTEGRHLGKRADVPTKENSWKNESPFLPFLPKHTFLYAAAPSRHESAEELVMQWGPQSRKEKRARVFNNASEPLRITFLDFLLIETLIIFKPGKSIFFVPNTLCYLVCNDREKIVL